ncbi:MAG TPA: hypothetical protein PLA50_16090 [Bacteroidia bacterium]|nr:hypothetical protein [Bacteroidia bacterium]
MDRWSIFIDLVADPVGQGGNGCGKGARALLSPASAALEMEKAASKDDKDSVKIS